MNDDPLGLREKTGEDDPLGLRKSPEQKKSYELSEVPSQAAKNFPAGMYNYMATFFDPETYKGLAESLKLLSPYEQEEGGYFKRKQIPKEVMGSVGRGLYDKYGTYENIKRTAAEHPEEVLGDLSTLISGGPGKIGAVGRAIEPLNVITAPIKGAMKLIPTSAETRLYASAIKGLTKKDISWAEKQEIIKKGIKEGIFPNERGLQKLGTKIQEATDKFDNEVLKQQSKGGMVRSSTVLDYLDELEKFYASMPDPLEDLETIARIKKNFMATHGMEIGGKSKLQKVTENIDTGLLGAKGKPIIRTIERDKIVNVPGHMEIPVKEAMDIKRSAYAKYKDSYGKLSTAEKEANKEIAYGIKEEFIKMNPLLRKVGQDEKVMIQLEEAIEAGLKRSQNYDVGRFPALIAGAATGATTGSGKLGAIAFAAKALMDTPTVKTALSIALNRAREISFGPKLTTTGRQILYQGGQLRNYMEE